MPVVDGVPLIVIVLLAQDALTPGGKPLAPEIPAFDIPVALVVVCVIFVNAVITVSVGVDDAVPAEQAVTHGTPGQFSNAAFFQRTLISSRL